MIEIVIKIPEKLYNRIKYLEPKADTMLDELMRSVQSGTPLSKHGGLIDKDKMMADLLTVDPQYQVLIDWCLQVIEAQPTIIEGE